MSLHRYIVKPESAWGTPLRSDTLAGLLLYRLAEDEGEDALRAEISAFMDGRPPFVLSSAMPKDTVFAPKLPPLPRKRFADLLEKGAFVGEKGKQFSAFEALSLFKKYRKKRFLPLSVWQRHCKSLSVADLFAEFCKNPGLWETPVAKRQQEMHVTISRNSSAALDGGLFVSHAYWPAEGMLYHLYAQTEDSPALLERLRRIGQIGFGRDASTGKGGFSIEEDAGFAPQTEALPHCLLVSILSAPDMRDLDGWYAVEVKSGKAGQGISRGNPYKSPFLCVQEGAVLTGLPKGPFVLKGLNANPDIVQITQPLTLPCRLAEENIEEVSNA